MLGSAREHEDSDAGRQALQIGEAVAARGSVVLTGGCPGLPHAASLGASSSGGLTVAVSPAMNAQEHIEKYGYPLDSEITLFTGMGTKGRNVILIRSADACVFIGGGIGTLNEFTIAFDELNSRCALGILKGTGGLSEELSRLCGLVGRKPEATLFLESDPDLLVGRLIDHVSGRS